MLDRDEWQPSFFSCQPQLHSIYVVYRCPAQSKLLILNWAFCCGMTWLTLPELLLYQIEVLNGVAFKHETDGTISEAKFVLAVSFRRASKTVPTKKTDTTLLTIFGTKIIPTITEIVSSSLVKRVTKAVRESKWRCVKEYFNPKLSTKSIWRKLKNIGLKDDPDHESIFTAEELNTYYYTRASQASQASQLLTFCPSAQNLGSTREQFSFRNVDNIEVRNAIFNVKSMAIGLDGISLILLCITHNFNSTFTKPLFSKSWKISKAMPISKLKNPCSLSEYRPINIFPSISKALHRKKYISCAGKMEDSLYLAMLAQWLFARWANIFASMANIFGGTAQYLPAWLKNSQHRTIFASMANILSGTAQY
jgi:hypothetical protein